MKSFLDIPFYRRPGGNLNDIGRFLPGMYWGQKEMFEIAWYEGNVSVALLEPGERYFSNYLCNPTLWEKLFGGEPYMLGRCLKYLVVNDMLPLRIATKLNGEPYKGGSIRYMLRVSLMHCSRPALRRYPSNSALTTAGKEVTLQ